MLEARPIVVDPDFVVLGGNMRLQAAQEVGLKEVPVYVATWDEAKAKEFVIKDNVAFGQWDWDLLANEWDSAQLNDWGMDVWYDASLEGVFEDLNESTYDPKEKEPTNTLVLEYDDDKFKEVQELIERVGGTKEDAVYAALIAICYGR